MKIIIKILLLSTLIVLPCYGETFAPSSAFDICFTPSDNCVKKITNTISSAHKQILVQAYSFTAPSIARALVKANKKGIDVRVILDKSQLRASHNLIAYLNRHKIKLFIDHIRAIAHNKIIIIDNITVIGGSYNYTKGAENRNAENVTIINDAAYA